MTQSQVSPFLLTLRLPAHSAATLVSAERARKDGLAAGRAVQGKRRRYPPSGGALVPLAFEDGGRPADETVAYVRTWGHGLNPGERSEAIRYGWQQLSNRLQVGNAEMILSSRGW